ncbi:MAG: hypothetical protein KGO49_13730 [Gammaproteobacteria bacterium]|nr:hypothetical protein [Gammaproteobacteria bacterium]
MSATRALDAANARAMLYQNIRAFFLSQQAPEVIGSSFPLNINIDQTSVFQISQQSRDEAIDRRHVAEFSVLQWVQRDWSKAQVLLDVDSFLQAIFAGEFEPERRTFRQAFIQRLGFDPDALTAVELRQEARRLGLNVSLGDDSLAWLKHMFVHFIEPTLGIDVPLYLTDLPDQWRDPDDDGKPVKSTTDVFIDGIKVGSVLSQHQQFNVVFGLDRLLMIILETRQIAKVFSM